MATSLVDAANSDYINAGNTLRANASKPVVYVFVEGLDDVSFWNACLTGFSDRYKFNITQLKKLDDTLAEGKTNLLNSIGIDSLGKFKLVAVDADYDWLIDNYRTSANGTSLSDEIRNNPYILHTYLYSIENFKCHPKCVREMVLKASNLVPVCDVTGYFEMFSKALAELFLIHIVSADLCDGVYTLKDFRTDADKVRIDFNSLCMTDKSRVYVESRLHCLKQYAAINSVKIEEYRRKLRSCGFSETGYYAFFQGHIVADVLFKKNFSILVSSMRKTAVAEINSCGTRQQKSQRIAQYEKITGIKTSLRQADVAMAISDRMDSLIYDCTDVENFEWAFNKIQSDLQAIYPLL